MSKRNEHVCERLKSVIITEEEKTPISRRIETPDGSLICLCDGTARAVHRCLLDLLQISRSLKIKEIQHRCDSSRVHILSARRECQQQGESLLENRLRDGQTK